MERREASRQPKAAAYVIVHERDLLGGDAEFAKEVGMDVPHRVDAGVAVASVGAGAVGRPDEHRFDDKREVRCPPGPVEDYLIVVALLLSAALVVGVATLVHRHHARHVVGSPPAVAAALPNAIPARAAAARAAIGHPNRAAVGTPRAAYALVREDARIGDKAAGALVEEVGLASIDHGCTEPVVLAAVEIDAWAPHVGPSPGAVDEIERVQQHSGLRVVVGRATIREAMV